MFRRRYNLRQRRSKGSLKFGIVFGLAIVLLLAAGFGIRQFYQTNLAPVSDSDASIEVVIEPGATSKQVASQLAEQELIRSARVFEWYVRVQNAGDRIQAGNYLLKPSMTTPQIVDIIIGGKATQELVTILPNQTIPQIRQALIDAGFTQADVDAALEPTQYESLPVLASKPVGASLEGFLFPESFERTAQTTPQDIIKQSLSEMDEQLTIERLQAFTARGLSTYEALIIASIVEAEASDPEDRRQIAQVFLTRLERGISLGSDVTAFYGAVIDGATPSVGYDSPYNTRIYEGFPPTPISNVSPSSLDAVAFPADTDWLFFVAGDDGTTYFSKTDEEHERLTEQYCTELCR